MVVAVLGCGPAGMIAVHAAVTAGHEVTVYSNKVKSHVFGAQYLHQPIPGIAPGDALPIKITKFGTRRGYAVNVYRDPNAEVSWDKFSDGMTSGWSLGETYDQLWDMYHDRIVDHAISGHHIPYMLKKFDMTFSTIPRPRLCQIWSHTFRELEIAVIHGPSHRDPEPNEMIYNGIETNGSVLDWYRYSMINGYESWEYSPPHPRPKPAPFLSPRGLSLDYGVKPLGTNCNCHPNLHRIGRFGKWDKNVFTHHSFQEVRNALQQVQ